MIEVTQAPSRKAVQISYEAWLRGRNVDASKKILCGRRDFSV